MTISLADGLLADVVRIGDLRERVAARHGMEEIWQLFVEERPAKLAWAEVDPDRILALDTMVINAIALLVLYGIWRGTAVYFEAAAVITTLVLLGQVLELKARGRTGAAIKALLGRQDRRGIPQRDQHRVPAQGLARDL